MKSLTAMTSGCTDSVCGNWLIPSRWREGVGASETRKS